MTHTDVAVHLPTLEAGGAERVMLTVANGLSERGYAVDLTVSNLRGGFKQDISNHVNVVEFSSTEPPFLPALGSFPDLCQYISNVEPSLFISSMKHINIISILAWKASGSNSKMVVTEHNTPDQLIDGSRKNALIYKIAKIEYPWADTIVGVSDGVIESLSETVDVPESEIQRIYNPVVTSQLIEKSKESASHRWFESEEDVVLNVGRMTEQKNQSLLIRAIAKLSPANRPKLIIVGKGHREEKIRELAVKLGVRQDLDIINWVDNLYAYMGSADVFALSSRWEGLPTVLIEALACGCPVVSMDCPSGPREILCDGEYGMLVDEYDPVALSEAVTKQLQNPDAESKIRERGKYFSKERCIDQYESLVLTSE